MDEEQLIKQAVEVIRRNGGEVDAMILCRELDIGYAQVTRLIDTLEDRGAIPPRPEIKVGPRLYDHLSTTMLVLLALPLLLDHKHISPALLQRKLNISYPKAAVLLDLLEAGGVVRKKDNRWEVTK